MTHIIYTLLKSTVSPFIMIACILFCLGCNKSTSMDEEVKSLFGKEMLLPMDFNMREAMIIHYVDSIGCIPCKIRPERWVAFHEKMNKRGFVNCDIVFVVHPYAYNDLLKLVKARGLSFVTIIQDKEKKFLKTNELKNSTLINTFLVDHENRILVVGSPFHNDKKERLYFASIEKLHKSVPPKVS